MTGAFTLSQKFNLWIGICHFVLVNEYYCVFLLRLLRLLLLLHGLSYFVRKQSNMWHFFSSEVIKRVQRRRKTGNREEWKCKRDSTISIGYKLLNLSWLDRAVDEVVFNNLRSELLRQRWWWRWWRWRYPITSSRIFYCYCNRKCGLSLCRRCWYRMGCMHPMCVYGKRYISILDVPFMYNWMFQLWFWSLIICHTKCACVRLCACVYAPTLYTLSVMIFRFYVSNLKCFSMQFEWLEKVLRF